MKRDHSDPHVNALYAMARKCGWSSTSSRPPYMFIMDLIEAAKPFRDAFDYDPGYSDLDDEQPITMGVTLGDWRKLNRALADTTGDSR